MPVSDPNWDALQTALGSDAEISVEYQVTVKFDSGERVAFLLTGANILFLSLQTAGEKAGLLTRLCGALPEWGRGESLEKAIIPAASPLLEKVYERVGFEKASNVLEMDLTGPTIPAETYAQQADSGV